MRGRLCSSKICSSPKEFLKEKSTTSSELEYPGGLEPQWALKKRAKIDYKGEIEFQEAKKTEIYL